MQIQSKAFENGERIPPSYTCDGENVNPPLSFSDIPKGVRSLVLVVEDPDAPAGLWVHWLVWNIPPHIEGVREGGIPTGAREGATSFGATRYGGPCPSEGEHRYFFKLYALDLELELSEKAGVVEIEEAMVGHVLDKAEIVGLYSRI